MSVERSLALLWVVLGAAGVAQAADPVRVPETFTATTSAMTPKDASLKIDVREWSDADARAAVVVALANESELPKALIELPTVGYVWQSGTAVGYAIKYAHRTATEQGERVTFVTDRLLGSYGMKPWTADAPGSASPRPYSVIELRLDGTGGGSGTLSLAADVALDADASVVSLTAAAEAPALLVNVRHEPKPYWAAEP